MADQKTLCKVEETTFRCRIQIQCSLWKVSLSWLPCIGIIFHARFLYYFFFKPTYQWMEYWRFMSNIKFTLIFIHFSASILPSSSFTGVGTGGGVSRSEIYFYETNSWSPISCKNSPGAAFFFCQVRVGRGFNPPQQFLLNGDNESNHPIWGWQVRGRLLIRLLSKDLHDNNIFSYESSPSSLLVMKWSPSSPTSTLVMPSAPKSGWTEENLPRMVLKWMISLMAAPTSSMLSMSLFMNACWTAYLHW